MTARTVDFTGVWLEWRRFFSTARIRGLQRAMRQDADSLVVSSSEISVVSSSWILACFSFAMIFSSSGSSWGSWNCGFGAGMASEEEEKEEEDVDCSSEEEAVGELISLRNSICDFELGEGGRKPARLLATSEDTVSG